MKKISFIVFLTLCGCNNNFINLERKKFIFSYKDKIINALYLYRESDQEAGFKANPEGLPLVFTWSKPMKICFNMKNINIDLYIYYFDENKNIIGKDYMKKNSNEIFCPSEKILYAIESTTNIY